MRRSVLHGLSLNNTVFRVHGPHALWRFDKSIEQCVVRPSRARRFAVNTKVIRHIFRLLCCNKKKSSEARQEQDDFLMWNRTKSECEKSKVIFKRRVVTPAHIMPNAVLRCISPLPPPIFSLILGLIQFPSDRLSHADAVSITTRGQTQAFIN